MTDDMMKKAFEEITEMELKYIENNIKKDTPIIASSSFNKKMETLIKNPYPSNSLFESTRIHKFKLRYIFIAILIMIMMASTVIAFTPIRDKLKNIIYTLFSDHIEIDSIENNPNNNIDFVIKIPHMIPEGYKFYNENIEENMIHLTWIDEEENTLDYIEQLSSELSINITSDGSEIINTNIGNHNGKIIKDQNNGITTILYEESGTTFLLIGYISQEELIKMASSIY